MRSNGDSGAAAQIDKLEADYRALADRARMLVARAGESHLLARPEPGRWSAAQCLLHLTLTTRAYLPLWREAYSAGVSDTKARDRFKLDSWGKVLLWFIEPPPKFRFAAPREFLPQPTDSAAEALSRFIGSQAELLKMLDEGRGLPLDRLKITSPFAGHVRYSVWSSFCILAAHERRHLLQAERAAGVA